MNLCLNFNQQNDVYVHPTVLLEARYSSNPPGDSVLNSRTMDVDVARKDFWTNENPDPSKWNDVSSAWGLRSRHRHADGQMKAFCVEAALRFLHMVSVTWILAE